MAYLLDSNVFIEAKNRHYAFEFCPAFWDWIEYSLKSGTVLIIEQVRSELMNIEDELSAWMSDLSKEYFVEASAVNSRLDVVSEWLESDKSNSFSKNAIDKFLKSADYFLISYALANRCTLVTHETTRGHRKKVKIPTVCDALSIPYIMTFEMLKREKVKFILAASSN